MPGHDVEWAVLLGRFEEFTTEFVHNLPRLLLDLIFCDWMQEIAGIGETVCSQWSYSMCVSKRDSSQDVAVLD